MAYAYLLLIIACANSLLWLVPDKLPVGTGHTTDVGILLIGLGLAYYLIKGSAIRQLGNFFTWYVVFYLLLVAVQVSIAAFKYGQPIMSGFEGGRSQLYYLSFPLFLLVLSDLDKLKVFMTAISALALVIVALALVNYFVVTIFVHEKAAGWGYRAGMVRAYIPGMTILVFAALWEFWSYLKDKQLFSAHLVMFLIIYGAVIFRQDRARVIALSVVLVLIMLAKRRYRMLAAAIAMVVVALLVDFTLGDGENMFLNAFESAYTELAQGDDVDEGTPWSARLKQVERSWHVFVDNFLTGSGGLVIHSGVPGLAGFGELKDIALNWDLGYWVWFKFFGFWGFVYLFALIIGFYWYALRCGKLGDRAHIGQFAAYHFIMMLISMLTINYVTTPYGIILMCLTWALVVRAAKSLEPESESNEHALALDSARPPEGDDAPDRLRQTGRWA